MITKHQIIRKADEDGVPAPTVERDYVLAHCLCAISAAPEANRFTLKGGTALRMCYVAGYRYSADLDLSLAADLTRLDALQIINQSLENVKQEIGFPTLGVAVSDAGKIEYEGPLGRIRWIKLDLDEDELVLSSATTPFLRRYGDLPQSEGLPTYALSEIAAEKLRCVIQRLQCRDFFDLHHLVAVETVDLDETWEMFEAKARHKGIDPADFFERFGARVEQYKERWADEMSEHVPGELPPFETMVRELKRRLQARRS